MFMIDYHSLVNKNAFLKYSSCPYNTYENYDLQIDSTKLFNRRNFLNKSCVTNSEFYFGRSPLKSEFVTVSTNTFSFPGKGASFITALLNTAEITQKQFYQPYFNVQCPQPKYNKPTNSPSFINQKRNATPQFAFKFFFVSV